MMSNAKRWPTFPLMIHLQHSPLNHVYSRPCVYQMNISLYCANCKIASNWVERVFELWPKTANIHHAIRHLTLPMTKHINPSSNSVGGEATKIMLTANCSAPNDKLVNDKSPYCISLKSGGFQFQSLSFPKHFGESLILRQSLWPNPLSDFLECTFMYIYHIPWWSSSSEDHPGCTRILSHWKNRVKWNNKHASCFTPTWKKYGKVLK